MNLHSLNRIVRVCSIGQFIIAMPSLKVAKGNTRKNPASTNRHQFAVMLPLAHNTSTRRALHLPDNKNSLKEQKQVFFTENRVVVLSEKASNSNSELIRRRKMNGLEEEKIVNSRKFHVFFFFHETPLCPFSIARFLP